MSANTSAAVPSTTLAQAPYTTGAVTARDGVTLGYRQLGTGPGVVLLHGAMESAGSHLQLAAALADAFTVYMPDRRGRGRSGPHGPDYTIAEEIADLEVLLAHTGVHNVFGVSSGGIICLQAALSLPTIHRVAVYEPAFFGDATNPRAFLARYDREVAQGKLAAALVTGMQGARMGPPIFNLMPRWLLERLTTMGMAAEEKKAARDDVTMRALAPTLHYDFQLVADMSGPLERYAAIRAAVLLLGGSASPAYLKSALEALQQVLPHAERVEFPGLNHGGSGNADRGGQPQVVAAALRRFFA